MPKFDIGSLFGWLNWNNVYGYSHARRNGRADGRAGVHGQAYVFELKNVCERWINDIGVEWAKQDKRLKAEYCDALNSAERARINFDHIAGRTGEHERALVELDQQYRERLGADKLGIRGYSVAVTLLCILELPINIVVIEALGLPGWEQWVAAAGLSIMFVACAHFLGKLLKQHSRFDGITSVEKILAAILTAVPVFAIGFVALLREKYVMKLNALGLSITESEVMLLFFSINVLFYLIGALFSYTHYNPALDGLRLSWGKRHRDIRGARGELVKAERLLAVEQQRLNWAEAAREKTHDTCFKRVRSEKDFFERCLSIYRKYKEREFAAHQVEIIREEFTSRVRIDVPPTIATLSDDGQILIKAPLDWTCPTVRPFAVSNEYRLGERDARASVATEA